MIRTARRFWVCLLVCALSLTAAIWSQSMLGAGANTPSAIDQPLSLITYNPPNLGAPGRTADGGSRRCAQVVALQPGKTHWGETTSTHPTFWMYVSGAVGSMTLTLSDEHTKVPFEQVTFTPTVVSGVGRYTLPYSAPSLAVDTQYRWTMSLTCPGINASSEVSGVIVRRAMSASLQAELSAASPRDRIALLAANGLWYDAVDELAELRLANQGDNALEADWLTLVDHIRSEDNLEQIPDRFEDKPLLGDYPNRMPNET